MLSSALRSPSRLRESFARRSSIDADDSTIAGSKRAARIFNVPSSGRRVIAACNASSAGPYSPCSAKA